LTDFQSFFTVGFCNKCATTSLLNFSPVFKGVAKLVLRTHSTFGKLLSY